MAEFKSITKKYGDKTVLDNFSLKAEKGSPTVIMGESGCGKTTLLRIAAGLEKADSGEFIKDGEEIAIMFQEPRLLPWKNALDNILSVLPKDSLPIAEKYFSATGLNLESDGKKLPHELSGGMMQRVAFARFLAYAEATNASILLLDEPFSALDETTAEKMALLLRSFAENRSLIVVSHDDSDAKNLEANVINL